MALIGGSGGQWGSEMRRPGSQHGHSLTLVFEWVVRPGVCAERWTGDWAGGAMGTEAVAVGEGTGDVTGAWVDAGATGAEDEAGGIASFQPG